MTELRTDPSPGTSTQLPGWMRVTPVVALVSAVVYGGVQLWWALGGSRPDFPPTGIDLLLFAGWPAVVLCALAAVATAVLLLPRPGPRIRWAAVGCAWAAAGCLVAASGLVALDLVALIFVGLGIRPDAAGALSRLGGLTVAGSLALTALSAQRRLRDACLWCGRGRDAVEAPGGGAGAPASTLPPSRFVVAAAYAATLGTLVRFGAQAIVGFGPEGNPLAGTDPAGVVAGLLFMACLLAAGTVLPLALVHRWGRVFPRWVPWLGGHGVPRWLLLVPAGVVSGCLLAYFGTGSLVSAGGGDIMGIALPAWFFPVAVGGYLVWGAGLAVATVSYFRRTRPACRRCGRL